MYFMDVCLSPELGDFEISKNLQNSARKYGKTLMEFDETLEKFVAWMIDKRKIQQKNKNIKIYLFCYYRY